MIAESTRRGRTTQTILFTMICAAALSGCGSGAAAPSAPAQTPPVAVDEPDVFASDEDALDAGLRAVQANFDALAVVRPGDTDSEERYAEMLGADQRTRTEQRWRAEGEPGYLTGRVVVTEGGLIARHSAGPAQERLRLAVCVDRSGASLATASEPGPTAWSHEDTIPLLVELTLGDSEDPPALLESLHDGGDTEICS